jgi:hypothetical protein
MKINKTFLVSLLCFLSLMFMGGDCNNPPQPPPDGWEVSWTYSSGNDPTADTPLSINVGGWKNIYHDQAGYSMSMYYIENTVVPSDANLDMSSKTNLLTSANDFLTRLEQTWGRRISNLEHGSYMFGVNAMRGAKLYDFGVTVSKHFMQGEPAISIEYFWINGTTKVDPCRLYSST